MTWHAHIEHRWATDQVAIHLLDRFEGGYLLLGPGGASLTTVTQVESQTTLDGPEPALVIRDAAAPALLGALSRHLGAVEHPEQLRRDYDAERARVDRFITHLVGMGRTS